MPEATNEKEIEVTYGMEFRGGLCEKCRIPFELTWENGLIIERHCPGCGGNIGNLIYRETTVLSPELPPMPEVPCPNHIKEYRHELDLWNEECKKILDLFEAIREYHSARCIYCQENRNDEIEEKYRTGEPAPETIDKCKEETRRIMSWHKNRS